MSVDFSPVILTMHRRRALERPDLLAVNKTFMDLGESTSPMSNAVADFFSKVVSKKYLSTLEAIAKKQDESQRLSYQNSLLSTHEAISMVLLSCLVEVDTSNHLTAHQKQSLQRQVDLGVLALSLRYYKADIVPRNPQSALLRTAENYYLSHALNDGLLSELSHETRTRIEEILLSTSPQHRKSQQFTSKDILFRNASDAVVLPFIGISYQINQQTKNKISAQNSRGLGESISFEKRFSKALLPFGSAQNTAYDTFIRRMLHRGASIRGKNAVVV